MKSFVRFAMLGLVLVMVALVSALTSMRFAIHGQEVAVPPLIGLTPSDAERSAAGLGLQVEIERQYYSPQIPEGRIMSQVPLPGTKVRRGWQVRVAQSLGPIRVAIPDVTGQSEHAAEFNIRRRGLDLASVAQIPTAGIPADQVLAQSPPANASDLAAPKISLLLTADPNAQAFVMPSFVGQPLGTASRTLQDAGFQLGNVTVAVAPVPDAASIQPGAPVANSPSAAGSTSTQPAATAQQAPLVPPALSPPPQNPPPQPSPASIIVSQNPAAGQRVLVGAVVHFEVR